MTLLLPIRRSTHITRIISFSHATTSRQSYECDGTEFEVTKCTPKSNKVIRVGRQAQHMQFGMNIFRFDFVVWVVVADCIDDLCRVIGVVVVVKH